MVHTLLFFRKIKCLADNLMTHCLSLYSTKLTAMSPTATPFYESLPELFQLVHRYELFKDGKVWADALPLHNPEELAAQWQLLADKSETGVKKFVETHFTFAAEEESVRFSLYEDAEEHIRNLWSHLLRKGNFEVVPGSSLISLPFDYIVPGGRFNEIYYWDSYFTMLGLAAHGHHGVIEGMIKNFDFFIHQYGFIPNGNRSYFLSRSQPPFFAMMVELLMEFKGQEAGLPYLPALVSEYNFWMKPPRSVTVDGHHVLNRYADNSASPRIEMYRDDQHLAAEVEDEDTLFLHLRSACESGWDFSWRWMDEANDLHTIRTHDLIPVDLNALLFKAETIIANLYRLQHEGEKASIYDKKAEARKEAMQRYCWNEGWFDYDLKANMITSKVTAAAMVPLFVNLCTAEEANITAKVALNHLLADGGLLTTATVSGQQWDAPNGWAPLQWIAVKGLQNYGMYDEANDIADRWLGLNQKIYRQTGKMLEKYNVQNTDLPGGGGEYPVQDGFGWTNGVFVALKHRNNANLML